MYKVNCMEEYLNYYKNYCIEFCNEFNIVDKIEAMFNKQKLKIENAFQNGVDIGGLLASVEIPNDLIYHNGDNLTAEGYYLLFKRGKKQYLHPICRI